MTRTEQRVVRASVPLRFPGFRKLYAVRLAGQFGDGVFQGTYELPDDQVEPVWRTGVDEIRELLEHGWR